MIIGYKNHLLSYWAEGESLLFSTVYVYGLTFKANDTGSAVKGNVIDIFFDGTESEAIQGISEFGDYYKVTILKEMQLLFKKKK